MQLIVGTVRTAINVARKLRLTMLISFVPCAILLNLKSETQMTFQEVRNLLQAYLPSKPIG